MVGAFKRLWRSLGFHVHTWGPWTDIGDVVRTCDGEKRKVAVCQIRECSECKKKQRHLVWYI